MKKYLFFFASILFAFLFTGCQNTLDTATAEKMVREVNTKFQQQPYQYMEQNTSSDYVFINGEGVFVTKEQMLAIAKDTKISKWDLVNLKVRALDHVLVATGINNHAADDGKAQTYNTAFTYIYQEKGGKLEQLVAQHTHVQNSTKEEEAAVKAVIERETDMVGALNKEQWSATRTQTENNLTIGAESGNVTITRGWQKELAAATAMFKDLAKDAKVQVERTNWNIRVSGNVAWATYDQLLTIPQFGIKDRRTTEIRCLEKTGEQWTISVLIYTGNQ